MPTEKTEKKPSSAERNTEQIIGHLNEYLSVRFDHAARIRPALAAIKQDLIYHEMANVRRCLMGTKIFGPDRFHVADIFLSDNEKRRRGLMSPTDQTSVQVELVSHCQDERVESTRGQIRIHDIKTFYASIDKPLADFMDLFETWIWWDLYDAVELARFEQKLGKISLVRQGKLSEAGRKRYELMLQAAASESEDEEAAPRTVSDEDIIQYELGQLKRLHEQWEYRRASELGYMFVLKRDELPLPSQGEIIHEIAEKVREYDAINSFEELPDEVCEAYAADLHLAPSKVTKQAIMDFIRNQLINTERTMLNQADHDQRLGPPYNYKHRQQTQMEKWLHDLEAQLHVSMEDVAAAKAPTS